MTTPVAFPVASKVTPQDFFAGINPAPTPEVLAIGDKYKDISDPDATGADMDPAVPTSNAPVVAAPEVVAIGDKYKSKAADGEDGTQEPPAVKVVETVAPSTAPTVTATAAPTDVPNEGADEVPYYQVADLLQEKGLIVDIPEGFPVDNVTKDNFWELINHNFTIKADEEFNSGYEAARSDIRNVVSPETLDILDFQINNPNAGPQEIKYHISKILYAAEVSDLDPSDPIDAETILRQYFGVDNTPDEIEFQIKEAKELGKLEQRAAMYKPKVEQRAQFQVQQSRQRQAQILQADAVRHQEFMSKVDNVLKNNTLLGVEIGQEERARIRAIFANNKVPVPVNGGQTVELGMMDYLIRKNMYTPDGNTENLLMAALVLDKGRAALEKYLVAPVKKEAAIKFATQKAAGTFSATPAASKNTTQQQSIEKKRETFWSRYKQ